MNKRPYRRKQYWNRREMTWWEQAYLPEILRDQIAHFFQHYKDLEKGKWVTIVKWVDRDKAMKMITKGLKAAEGK